VPKKAELEQHIVALEKSKTNRLEPLRNFILEANQAEKRVSEENWLEMKSFLQRVGSNRLLRAQTLTVSFKKPADLLAETNLAVHRTNDVSLQSSNLWSRQESNLRPSHCERDALPTELRPRTDHVEDFPAAARLQAALYGLGFLLFDPTSFGNGAAVRPHFFELKMALEF
jgi:hypothetical protein